MPCPPRPAATSPSGQGFLLMSQECQRGREQKQSKPTCFFPPKHTTANTPGSFRCFQLGNAAQTTPSFPNPPNFPLLKNNPGNYTEAMRGKLPPREINLCKYRHCNKPGHHLKGVGVQRDKPWLWLGKGQNVNWPKGP